MNLAGFKKCRYCWSDDLNYTYRDFSMALPTQIICENCGCRGPLLTELNTGEDRLQKLREIWNQNN